MPRKAKVRDDWSDAGLADLRRIRKAIDDRVLHDDQSAFEFMAGAALWSGPATISGQVRLRPPAAGSGGQK